eukprot:CAMPEP_0119261652 /NCGR_PEP_ID=MMETSP1329-20130426/1639_1 /TAXON_ID=114041 /ORGANISM="Genus nov. species nov., Strain RCC1024" /LENGTH=920 /DNA_ID=CAMNT_0007261227 /DNA_START=283 /DNA_END=3045 /DNA_ORIENTATION=-
MTLKADAAEFVPGALFAEAKHASPVVNEQDTNQTDLPTPQTAQSSASSEVILSESATPSHCRVHDVSSSGSAPAAFEGSTPISAEDEILDSWEDVGPVAEPAGSLKVLSATPVDSEEVVVSAIRSRYSYTKQELFEFRLERSTAPPDLPSFAVERSAAVEFRGNRRLGPGGATRSGGAGAGGGGSSGNPGGYRHGGSMEDPRRDQSLRGARHRKTDHTSASEKWDRGQRVKQKEGTPEHWGPEAFEPLKTTAHRWDRSQKATSELEASLNVVVSILNKMTPQNFDKLSGQLCDLEITSSEMLRRVIGVIFDKAVDEPHFAVVYAALCARLAEVTRVWPFIRSVQDKSRDTWSWVADLEVDTSKLLPLPDVSAVEMLLSSSDTEHEEIGVGQLQLHPSDCYLQNDKLVCCYSAKQRPGIVFAVVEDARAQLFGDGKSKLFGSFATKEEAQQDAMKKASFKRLLLNQCQEEFEKNVRNSCNAEALEAAAREAKEKLKNAAIEAARIAEENGVPPPEIPEELELEVWVTKLKRRMLGNVKFIGELFKQHLLKEKTMHECIKLLLGSLDDPNVVPDDESIEAAAKLFFTIGKQLESPPASKAKLDAYCKRLATLSKDKAKLAARTRFMLQDLLECRRNGWKERQAKDGPHKLGRPKSSMQLQQAKSETQYRRDQERHLARERQRQAVSQHQLQGAVMTPTSASCSQDIRQIPHSQSSTVRILARDKEVQKTSSTKIPTSKAALGSVPRDTDLNTMPIIWTDDRVTNRARSSLDEYDQLSDPEELVASLDEVPSANRVYKRVFELSVNRITEGKDSERAGAFKAIHTLISKQKLKSEDVTETTLDTLTYLPDISIDSPKAIEHVASLLSVTLRLGVVEMPLLKQAFGDGNSISSEHKLLLENLIRLLSEYPDEVELKSLLELQIK